MALTYYLSRLVLSAVQGMELIMSSSQLYLKTKSGLGNNSKVPITRMQTRVSSLQLWMVTNLDTTLIQERERLETIFKEIDHKLKVQQDRQVMYH